MPDTKETIALAHTAAAPREARRFVTATLTTWHLDELIEDVVLLVSELVSNVIYHTDETAVLTIARTNDHVRCSVVDQGGTPPKPRAAAPSDRTGRGLQLVDRLSATWGSNTMGRRNEVWFEVLVVPRDAVAGQ